MFALKINLLIEEIIAGMLLVDGKHLQIFMIYKNIITYMLSHSKVEKRVHFKKNLKD